MPRRAATRKTKIPIQQLIDEEIIEVGCIAGALFVLTNGSGEQDHLVLIHLSDQPPCLIAGRLLQRVAELRDNSWGLNEIRHLLDLTEDEATAAAKALGDRYMKYREAPSRGSRSL